MAQYAGLLGKSECPRRPPLRQGTLRWLIADYKSGPKFARLAAKTQHGYARMLDIFMPLDHFQANEVKRIHLHELRKQFLSTPRTADEFAKVASILFSHAVDIGLIERNPAEKIQRVNESEPYKAWTDDELLQFERACLPVPIRTAFMLGLYTGQRRDDVLKMTWASYDGTYVSVRQGKTQTFLQLRVHSNLKVYLDRLPREALLLVPSPRGTLWDASAFSKAFKVELNKVGLTHLTFHGLRHTAGRMLAEAGCSEFEIASITGHKSLTMVAHYTRQASQRRLSDAAVTRLEKKQKPET